MSKRKGLTAEEKREKLLELLYETFQVYQLKDLERLAPTEKGIVSQSVKSTLQELVDSGKVRSEKIAGSTYYWAFPDDAIHKMEMQIEANEAKSKELQQNIEIVTERMEAAEAATQAENIDLQELEDEIEALKREKNEVNAKLASLSNNVNYEDVEVKENDTKEILGAANRWTDNIFSIKSWCKKKFNKEDKDMNKAFGIPEDLDYLDD